MARKKKSTAAKRKFKFSPKASLIKLFAPVGRLIVKATGPIRRNRLWKFLRQTILRSPFRGYFVDSWRELRQVTWPNRSRTWRLTFVVILFSLLFAGITAGLDYGFEHLAKRIFL